MIAVVGRMEVDPKIFLIKQLVGAGMKSGAEKVAKHMASDAKEILRQKVFSSGGNWSGRLADAIGTKNADPGSPVFGYARHDVVVNTAKAPYAAWVEFGNRTVYLPYYRSGGKDYSKSKFKGHRFLTEALRKYRRNGVTLPIIAKEIVLALLGGKGVTLL